MPLDVAPWGLQASHSYYPTLTMPTNPLVIMHTICSTFLTPPQLASPLLIRDDKSTTNNY
jgi:hypothetical protein